jgi:hypothetical protein
MTTYVVVESVDDAAILQATLSPQTLAYAALIVGGGTSAGVSLARSLISDRGEPLLFVMDADTVSLEAIVAQEQAFRDLIGAVAIDTPYDVILAVPQLEVIFFYNVDLLAALLHTTIGQETMLNGMYEPRKTLDDLLTQNSANVRNRQEFLQSIDDQARQQLAMHPIIQRMTAFIVRNAEVVPA